MDDRGCNQSFPAFPHFQPSCVYVKPHHLFQVLHDGHENINELSVKDLLYTVHNHSDLIVSDTLAQNLEI